jgi:TolB-like protein/DNA-binding winged helix-turn-helix (wHTH) protein
MRRGASVNDSRTLKIGEWTATPALNLLERGGETVRLEARAMDVLMALARQPGEVLSLDTLIATVWKGVVVGDGSVYLAINQLRHALDGKQAEVSHIETIPKRGYRLVVPVEHAAPTPQVVTPPGWRHAGRVAGVIVAVALVAGAAWFVLRDGIATGPEPQVSIAVLPFANLSSDVEQAYFADGLTEELVNVLTQIRELRVTGRASSFYFKERAADVGAIAATLGVRHVLEGSVRRAGDDLRIGAKLVDARTGYSLWSKSYERGVGDIFAIQDEIAAEVAAALQVTLGVGEVGRRPGMTRNFEAYEEYLRAFSLQVRFDPSSWPKTIEHLERAVALDPAFSVAWASMSATYANQAQLVPELAAESRERAADALEHARTLTPDAPDVLVRTSIELMARGKWLDAGAVHARAVAMFADRGIGGEASAAQGFLLLSAGRPRAAVAAFDRARAIDPLVPAYTYGLANARLAAGDVAAALAEVDRGLGLAGFGPVLRATGVSAALAGGEREALRMRLDSLAAGDLGADLNRNLAALRDDRGAALAELRRAAETADVAEKALLAEWAASYDEPAFALELLAGVPPEYVLTNGLLWRPMLGDARKLPTFKELARALGLVEYWRVYGWPDGCRPSADAFTCGE